MFSYNRISVLFLFYFFRRHLYWRWGVLFWYFLQRLEAARLQPALDVESKKIAIIMPHAHIIMHPYRICEMNLEPKLPDILVQSIYLVPFH